MKCPKCGYQRTPHDNIFVPATECPSCGVVYVKSESDPPSANVGPNAKNKTQKASPVDAESLKKARERVEMRLRKQLENRLRDDRHAQTLERARRIAVVEARKRRLKMEQRHQEADPPEGQEHAEQKMAEHTAVPAVEPQGKDRIIDVRPTASDESALSAEKDTQTMSQHAGHETDDRPYTLSESAPDLPPSEGEESPVPENRRPPVSAPAPQSDPAAISADSEKSPPEAPLQSVRTSSKPTRDNVIPLSTAADYFPTTKGGSRGGLMRLMPLVAWLILCAGVVGAVLSWTTLTDVQANVQTGAPPLALNALPMGLLLGFAYLATGVLGFAFFWVSSLITRQLKDIRDLLLYQHAAQPSGNGLSDELNESME